MCCVQNYPLLILETLRFALEKHCWRDVKAVAEPFYLLSVELTPLFQNQGHNTFAAQILCKILLSKSIRIHQFLQHFDAEAFSMAKCFAS
jgi:hypothetical protein